ncbi:MAG TPA: hypothetical protein HA257_06410 [Candidatus Methanoperedenaceae archaeon]|nr:hypothetical protein [Candidatus Methanoperedenaceae archaeon]
MIKANAFLVVLVIPVLAAQAAGAERIWENDITIYTDGLSWNYTDAYSDASAQQYRHRVDASGNNDSFVSAWELYEMEKVARTTMKNNILAEFDVRVDNSSSGIELLDISAALSPALIGSVNDTGRIVNRYSTRYSFDVLLRGNRSLWLMGEPKSPVHISTVNITIISSGGISNVTISDSSLSGIAGASGEMRVELYGIQEKAAESHTPAIEEPKKDNAQWIKALVGSVVVLLLGVLGVLVYLIYARNR